MVRSPRWKALESMHPASVQLDQIGLRPWRPDEAETYLAGRDQMIYDFTTETRATDIATCRSNIESGLDDPGLAPFAIVDENNAPIGNMAVVRRGDGAELSYWLAPSARGRGWATIALDGATRWAFEHWPVGHAQLEILESNTASIATAVAAGFHRHGTRLESSCGGPALLFRRVRDD